MKRHLRICFCMLGLLTGCSGADSPDTDFLGTWRIAGDGGRHTLMSLRNNGTFEIDLRIEGDLTKIVDKKGSAGGTWEADIDNGLFVLNVTRPAADIGWPEGETTYRIEQMDKRSMVLASPDGRAYHWGKNSPQNHESVAVEAAAIPLAPLVVSLTPSASEANRRYKWLCVAMDIQLLPGTPAPEFQPRWKDKILLLLSSKAYEDVNTLDKLETVSNEIRVLLNPYLDGAVGEVVFSRSLVTGRQEAVDSFCAEFES